jgi:DNA-binding NtrC family response regulator
VISTSQIDLRGEEGAFHQNLLYSLRAIELKLPPLREHLDDLPELVGVFLSLYSHKNSKSVSHISDDAMRVLRQYSWPGNIRELEHAIERAVVMTRSAVLFPEDFPQEIWKPGAPQIALLGHQDSYSGGENSPSLEHIERAHILSVLQDVGYNKSKAAEVLGIDRATLYRKAQKYQIELRQK